MRKATQFIPAKVDQSGADDFLKEQLTSEALEAAAKVNSYPLALVVHEG